MDEDVAALIREERLREAAELLASRGEARKACELFERACLFSRAAEEAARDGRVDRALLLAARAGDDTLASALAQRIEPEKLDRTARDLAQAGYAHWTATLFARAGNHREAGLAWEEAHQPIFAA